MDLATTKKRIAVAARPLARYPRLKSVAKRAIFLGSELVTNRHPSQRMPLAVSEDSITVVLEGSRGCEYFLGYYDTCPDNGEGWVLGHQSHRATRLAPYQEDPVGVVALRQDTGELLTLGASVSYNWQQGARVQWMNRNTVIYNSYDQDRNRYIARTVSLSGIDERTFDWPVQDIFGEEYYLSVNYGLLSLANPPDYGYRNIDAATVRSSMTEDSEGVRRVECSTGESSLVLSLKDLAQCCSEHQPNPDLRTINHVMISPTGDSFVFVDRSYRSNVRYDRLLFSDFSSIRVLVDSGMVSHLCWINESLLMGYMRVGSRTGFFYLNVENGAIWSCGGLDGFGDGHPTVFGKWIAFDSYPGFDGMQRLFLYNTDSERVVELARFFHGVKYWGQSRCDLHPRFDKRGSRLFVDTVCTGWRSLMSVSVEEIMAAGVDGV